MVLDEITWCITEQNRQLHKCHTLHGMIKMNSCKPENCPSKVYVHNCVRCHPVVARCETCKKVHHFQPGDPDRGDHFLRSIPIDSWMCPACGAMELGVDEHMDRSVQTSLEGFSNEDETRN